MDLFKLRCLGNNMLPLLLLTWRLKHSMHLHNVPGIFRFHHQRGSGEFLLMAVATSHNLLYVAVTCQKENAKCVCKVHLFYKFYQMLLSYQFCFSWIVSSTGRFVIMPVHIPDSKVHGANMEPTWALSAPDGSHLGLMDLAIRESLCGPQVWRQCFAELKT